MNDSAGYRMFDTGLASDIIVKCDGMELKLHTFILSEYSGYFKAAINFGCGSYLDMDIEDIGINTKFVPYVLRRVYTGQPYVFDTMEKHIEISKVYKYLIIDFDVDNAIMDGKIYPTLKGDGYTRAIHFGGSPIRDQSMRKSIPYLNYLLGIELIKGYEYHYARGMILRLNNESVPTVIIPRNGLEFQVLKNLVE